MEQRYQEAVRIAAELISHGYNVVSPIVHNHPLVKHGRQNTGWSDWKKWDLKLLDACRVMFIVKMEGWKESTGVREEWSHCAVNDYPVLFVDPTTLSISNAQD